MYEKIVAGYVKTYFTLSVDGDFGSLLDPSAAADRRIRRRKFVRRKAARKITARRISRRILLAVNPP